MDKWGSRTDVYMQKVVLRLDSSKWDEIMEDLHGTTGLENGADGDQDSRDALEDMS